MIRSFLPGLLIVVTFLGMPALAGPARVSINGQIVLVNLDGEVETDPAEFAHAVAFFEPKTDTVNRVEDIEAEAVINTRRRQFLPRVLAIQAGTKIRFPNEDVVLHNVFSTSHPNAFDLGLYGQGAGETQRFDHPGLIRVFCNVHPAMFAHVVVVNGPYFVTPDARGRFELSGLPNGPGVLTLWHERSEPLRIELTINDEPIELESIELAMTIRQLERQRERRRQPLRRGNF